MSSILIIEDDQNLLEGLAIFLRMEGYTTLATTNGTTGLELIRRHIPDVVVTNLQMPGANGFDVLHAVRSEAALTATRVVFITAIHKPTVRERAIQDGVDAFMTKPFSTEDLSEVLSRLLAATNHEQLI